MTTKSCDCRDSTIVEGLFDDLRSNEDFSSFYGGDADENSTKNVKSYVLTNLNRMEVVLIALGATIVSLKCPDKYGRPADVVLGFDDLGSYMNPRLNQYFGCVLGRCANRIKNGSFTVKNRDYQLSLNDNHKHHLHGGVNGFGRKIWESCVDGCTVVMSYMSEDGQEGYPGAVLSTIRFKLTPDNKLEIGMRATTTKSTIVNLSHGSLFNLAGHDAGERELTKHRISLNCDRWTFTDLSDPIPTGAIRGVGGTIMDLRIPRLLRDAIKRMPSGEGFDHNFCVTRSSRSVGGFVARALHPESGRILEVYSDQPGVQFYTGANLSSSTVEQGHDEIPSDSTSRESFGQFPVVREFDSDEDYEKTADISRYVPGKGGAKYERFGAFSIQPQNYPNAVNYVSSDHDFSLQSSTTFIHNFHEYFPSNQQPHFPCSILHPGQVYYHDLTYKFGIQLGNYM